MASERVAFTRERGHRLAGQLETPDAPCAFALFAHCFTCTRNIRAARTITRGLAGQGIAVLRFDFTGLGESEGDFADTNFSSNVEDLVAAARYLEEHYEAPKLLVGHSLGGTAVLEAAAEVPSCVAVATIGSPFLPAHVGKLLESKREEIEAGGEAVVHLAGRPFRIRKQFLDDIEGAALPRAIKSLRRALLVMHSPVDETVEVENAAQIFSTALHPKSFVSLDTADHLLSRDEDAEYAARVLAAWASRYVGEAGE